ncbi:hypothetical protein [Rhodococcus spongiicola]|uniref:Uncharacterized protein n=1 Tax=Rhodococcus spongiicola TaxID=2487352 RepID=A0A3S3A8U2_9NOCA|nr:hypothetical protein [Rhodococcus spongiicola]RVW02282.1 hypothetical protein EF834_11720 [Rhodococcus spongiicola]
MITGEIKNKVDAPWDALWTCGISNPLAAKQTTGIASIDMTQPRAHSLKLPSQDLQEGFATCSGSRRRLLRMTNPLVGTDGPVLIDHFEGALNV